MILEAVLENVESVRELDAAFQAYDEVFRPRVSAIVAPSREIGGNMCGRVRAKGWLRMKFVRR